MGIRAIKLEEVKEIMSQILGSKILQVNHLDRQNEIRLALNAALLANRSASIFSFGTVLAARGRKSEIQELRLFKVKPKPSKPARLRQELEDLLLNCISEGGTDFMPSRYREVIEKLVHRLKSSASK